MSSDGLERLAQCSRALVALSEDVGGFPAPTWWVTPTLSPIPGYTTPSSEAPRTYMAYIYTCKQGTLYIKKKNWSRDLKYFQMSYFHYSCTDKYPHRKQLMGGKGLFNLQFPPTVHQ